MIYMETKIMVQPGKMGKYQEVEKDLYTLVTKAGMKVIGIWHTVIGDTNDVTLLVASEDMGQLPNSKNNDANADISFTIGNSDLIVHRQPG